MEGQAPDTQPVVQISPREARVAVEAELERVFEDRRVCEDAGQDQREHDHTNQAHEVTTPWVRQVQHRM